MCYTMGKSTSGDSDGICVCLGCDWLIPVGPDSMISEVWIGLVRIHSFIQIGYQLISEAPSTYVFKKKTPEELCKGI